MNRDLTPASTVAGLTQLPQAQRRWTRWGSSRLRLLVCVGIVVAALGWITARGLTGSFVYYLTPTDIATGQQAQVDERVRVGGYVVPGTVERDGGAVSFTVTDDAHTLRVVSTGPVPRMFRDGQGVVLEGALGTDGRFHSDTLLVKHDGTYEAPEGGVPGGAAAGEGG